MTADTAGRPNQLRRTRKDLLQAAARLANQGRNPSLEEVAAEAMVSRATAYRHFPDVASLLIEASLDMAVPAAEQLFGSGVSDDPLERLERLDTAFDEVNSANENALRLFLAHSLERRAACTSDPEVPARQNRRTPLIEAALEPARKQFKPAALKNLSSALALVIGTESMVVFKDVLELDAEQARQVRRWAIRALVDAARKSSGQAPRGGS